MFKSITVKVPISDYMFLEALKLKTRISVSSYVVLAISDFVSSSQDKSDFLFKD